MTGVDRVEQAYLARFLQDETPCFGLVRSAVGFLVLDRGSMSLLHAGQLNLTKTDLIGRIAWRRDPARGRAEAAVRRLAIARCARRNLDRTLRQHLPPGATYFNVGHANLDHQTLKQLRDAALRVVVLVHDTIPLDHLEFARPDTVAQFRRKMQAVSNYADLVIHTTHDARAKTDRHLAKFGRLPNGIVVNLGVPTPFADVAMVPTGIDLNQPYFICIGTIEPRKNHGFLLDLWENLGTSPDVPQLLIVGGRGWASAELFARLDALPTDHPVKLLTGLPDSAVAALLQNSIALLFPSNAEGFGLPVVEAAAMGVPVITSKLAVIKELIGDYAVYLDVSDIYSWMETIKSHAGAASGRGTGKKAPRIFQNTPSWADHFKAVLTNL